MPLTPRNRMKNTQKIRKELMKNRMNKDELDLRTAHLEPPEAHIPIAYAKEKPSVKSPPQRDILKELSKCREEYRELKKLLDRRSSMLSTALTIIEKNGLRIPKGTKKFKKTMINKSKNKKLTQKRKNKKY